MNYTRISITVETVLGENDEHDNLFFAYLDEYSIDYTIGDKGESGYPSVTYTGGPIALGNMLKERFGLDEYELKEIYPELYGEENTN